MKFGEYLSGLSDKRVTVIGAGISNKPLIEALLAAGIDTTVSDKRTYDDLGETSRRYESFGAKLRLGEGYLDELDADVIFRTPGLMPAHPTLVDAVKRGAVLTSEMEAFFSICPCKIIAVTGSDGKTTTTSIIADLLEKQGFNVHIGGNIGRPLLCETETMGPADIVVLELSSFQLITMKKSPHIAVYTNLSPNHLDIHADMGEYTGAKRNIYIHQKSTDRLVINYDNANTRAEAEYAPGHVLFFSCAGKVAEGVYLDRGTIYNAFGGQSEAIINADEILIPGLHNVENFMAAFAAVSGLVDFDIMRDTARAFRGVRHRIELVREVRGVKYYNDSIASSPSRTNAGLRAFDRKVILIAGGKDKGVPFDSLGNEIIARVKTLVLTGATAKLIYETVVKAEGYDGTPEIIIRDDFGDAVLAAAEVAEEGDVVLLSPACTSFDRFSNFEERGDTFRKIVEGM